MRYNGREQYPARNSHAEMEGIQLYFSLCPYVPPPFKQNVPHSASTQQRDLKPYTVTSHPFSSSTQKTRDTLGFGINS
eukprot:8880600-Ditylum_brightwellii.AAC.1